MDRLWDIVEKERIKIKYKDMSNIPEELSGLYLYDERFGAIIVLDSRLQENYRLHKCVLAHELGHYFTSSRTNILQAHASTDQRIVLSQDERKAHEWATNFLMPNNLFNQAVMEGCQSAYDLAEWFQVTEWFVYRKMGCRTDLRGR